MKGITGQPILILGMHRSGTSYLAGLMQSLGVYIGDDLVGAQKGNLRGHFEARPLLEFHQKLIAARDTTERKAFDDGMLVQQALGARLTEEEEAEAMAIIGAMERSGPWGWKEPRTCLFLAGWRKLLPEARAVVVYRHPLEVHQSLLRRDHWDLALFPDQAIQAYVIYNNELLENAPDGLIFNANAGFADPTQLRSLLRETFGLAEGDGIPEFHAAEFLSLSVSRALHDLFALFFPEAAAVFDKLQERSAIPWQWDEREDDDQLREAAAALKPLLEGTPKEVRPAFVPLLDWWAGGRKEGLVPRYEALAREIADHVTKVKEWNEEAAAIFEENKRLAADYEKMGTEFAKQQAFLAKQAETSAKVWADLKWTGDSWKEQKKFIEHLETQHKKLQEENLDLKKQLNQLKNPQK